VRPTVPVGGGRSPATLAMKRLVYLLGLSLLLSGCRARGPGELRISILDQLLIPDEVVVRVKAAECDLPNDKWETHPKMGHFNRSRSGREIDLAHELLPDTKPRLSQMSARELLNSLKTFPHLEYGSFPGVAYYVYRDGNKLIMEELSLRSQELKTLRGFRDDLRSVFTGIAGPGLSIGELVRYDLLHEPN
jgi:hypothetical protein